MQSGFSFSLTGLTMLLGITAAAITVNAELFRDKPLTASATREIVRQEIKLAIQDADRHYPRVVLAAAFTESRDDKFNIEFFEQIEALVSFENAEQSIEDDYRRSKIAFAAFRFVERLRDRNLPEGVHVHAEFHGGADARGGAGIVGRYDGSHGDPIRIERPILYHPLFGETPSLSRTYRKGAQITNEDLALIRAYAMYIGFMEHIAGKGWVDSMGFRGSTSNAIGERFRFGLIRISLTAGGVSS